ncbi:EF-hand domain-containing protein [Martelella lutilitoris]|uniref:EF-hand domain-containing protein n=1 Tax=Martelella lutilitoris TaxID=2583532 RepID=A0A7T7HGG5_9HYPH|nr:EF-hand domain-containing protein [Martelella lutilitoris]QQM28763.1 EF-hand domain-containing protein [Martelella lutilitoris]
MSKFLIASAIVLTLGAAAAVANPAHHSDGQNGMMMGEGMMPGNVMGRGMMNSDMMVVMLDTNGDGAIALAEFQAMHERMFRYLDTNGDGQLDASELAAHHDGFTPDADQE